jgi:hypothetical protein
VDVAAGLRLDDAGLIDWQPEGSPEIVRQSPAEQLLRGAQGSDQGLAECMPRLSTSTKRHKPSFLESGKIPTLGQMIRDARGDQQVIRRSTQQALRAWFRQSERLNTARREYRLRGPRFVDFARRIGVTDQSSAYHLVHLRRYRVQIISRCENDATAATKRGQIYRYPGWETALG